MTAHLRFEICDDKNTAEARKGHLEGEGYKVSGPTKAKYAAVKSFGYDDPGDDPKLKGLKKTYGDADGTFWTVYATMA